MISDARGGHVSPGIYTEEKDITYAAKSLGITSLGLVGETLKGPAFQPIAIEDWSDFVDYFGGTSPEKYKGTGYPKYELPYIAKSYLNESRNLHVCRVLGLSGYNAGKAWVINYSGTTKFPVVVLRSKGTYESVSGNGICEGATTEEFKEYVTSISLKQYSTTTYTTECVISSGTTTQVPYTDGKFALEVTYNVLNAEVDKDGNVTTTTTSAKTTYNVSLNSTDRDYIYNIFSNDPLNGTAPVYIESVYDVAYKQMKEETFTFDLTSDGLDGYNDYKECFRAAATPWIVSEVKYASTEAIEMKKLFKFYTISDGNASNYQVKISIQNIKPDDGTFDVVVRDFYDDDFSPVVLEKFSKCTMVEGTNNFIGLRIGTIDGLYENRSKYIAVEMSTSEGIEECVPAGFLGYPMPTYGSNKVPVAYNTDLDTSIKPKRQYFGLNKKILDVDIVNYKGKNAYAPYCGDAQPSLLTRGFHLDAIMHSSAMGDSIVKVDGESGYLFDTVNPVNAKYSVMPRINTEEYMKQTIYSDVNVRKFTVYPYGGFDGWDIHRPERTNTDEFKATQYKLISGEGKYPFTEVMSEGNASNPLMDLKLPATAITSDYYAYLGAYNQFANAQEIDINVFATPGIDFFNNSLLVDDVIDMIEDPEDGRGGDALYIFTTPQFNGVSGEEYTAQEVVEQLDASDIDSSYAATYFPWVKYYDTEHKMYLNLPVTKDVVRNLAATDNTSYPWYAPAGVNRGIVDCVRAYRKTRLDEEDVLYNGRINPVKTFGVDGVKIWGNKTAYAKDTPLNRINVRRLMIRVKKLIISASKSLIFEQYDATLEKQFRAIVEPILSDVRSNRGIADFRVITENTAETRDQHILPAKIMIKPINALEYISISFTVYPESVNFENE